MYDGGVRTHGGDGLKTDPAVILICPVTKQSSAFRTESSVAKNDTCNLIQNIKYVIL